MKTKFAGFKIANALIHPSVYISKRNAIGVGSIICEGSTITTNIKIGNFVIINRGSNISHDDSIGDYVTVGPGVNIAGNVTIEEERILVLVPLFVRKLILELGLS